MPPRPRGTVPDTDRRLFLASLIIDAARSRPGAAWETLVQDAARLGSRFGPTSAWPGLGEFDAIAGLTLAQITAPR